MELVGLMGQVGLGRAKCFGALLLAMGISACSSTQNSPSVAAAPNIEDSFTVKTSTLSANSSYQIAIARSALEKEFLLEGSVIPQTVSPTGNSIKSRIVAFRERGGKLYMLEASAGHVVTNDLPSNILLAQFPEIASDDKEIVFDFNAGMANLFTMTDDAGADLSGSSYDANAQFAATPVADSFLQSVTLSKSNQLVIRQIAQLAGNGSLSPTEIRYYISPYQADTTYQPVTSNADFSRFGFFQTNPQLDLQSDTIIYANRWNPSQKVVYAISANAPAAYRQALKDGVLYWNNVFGKEVVQVVDAPAGVTAPSPDYNIIQWVPYNSAGFAYADMQSDPRTGEFQHAQIYMTSVFAFGTKAEALQILRILHTGKKAAAATKQLQLRGFESEKVCDYDSADALIPALESLVADQTTSDADAQKAALDYLRLVTAHEVGHTLGLRHNFAGSLAVSYPVANRLDMVKQYFAKKTAPANITVSSSVMDYLLPQEDFLIGDQIKNGAALSYDQKAISTLYNSAHYSDSEWPLFCTDSSNGAYYDCNTFDAGASMVEYNSWNEQDQLDRMANALIELYISNKTPLEAQDSVPVQNLPLPDPTAMSKSILAGRTAFLQQMTSKAAILSVQRQLDVAANFNSDVVRSMQTAYLSSEVTRLGGFAKIFPALPSNFADQTIARMDQLLQKVYHQGTASGDQAFSFSDAEIKVMEANSRIFLNKFVQEYQKQELAILGGGGIKDPMIQSTLADQLADYLASRAKDTIFATSGQTITESVTLPGANGKSPTKITVQLPVFSQSDESRLLAAMMLNPGRSNDLNWGYTQRTALASQLIDLIEKSFNGANVEDLDPSQLPDDVARWLNENVILLKVLQGKPVNGN